MIHCLCLAEMDCEDYCRKGVHRETDTVMEADALASQMILHPAGSSVWMPLLSSNNSHSDDISSLQPHFTSCDLVFATSHDVGSMMGNNSSVTVWYRLTRLVPIKWLL